MVYLLPGAARSSKMVVCGPPGTVRSAEIVVWRPPEGVRWAKIMVCRPPGAGRLAEMIVRRLPGAARPAKILVCRPPGAVGSTRIVVWRSSSRGGGTSDGKVDWRRGAPQKLDFFFVFRIGIGVSPGSQSPEALYTPEAQGPQRIFLIFNVSACVP